MDEQQINENKTLSGDDIAVPTAAVTMCAAYRTPRWSSAHGLSCGWLLRSAGI